MSGLKAHNYYVNVVLWDMTVPSDITVRGPFPNEKDAKRDASLIEGNPDLVTTTLCVDLGYMMKDEDRIDELETALHRIQQWSEAYPLDIFPEPDFKRAHELLTAGGITLDAVSASCMRHVVEGVGKIAREALGEQP